MGLARQIVGLRLLTEDSGTEFTAKKAEEKPYSRNGVTWAWGERHGFKYISSISIKKSVDSDTLCGALTNLELLKSLECTSVVDAAGSTGSAEDPSKKTISSY